VRTRQGFKLIHPVRIAFQEDREFKRYLLADRHEKRSPQLYALHEDPEERRRLSLEDSKVFENLKKALYHWQERYMDDLGDAPPPTSELDRRLKELGYVK
jgi:hypothetical protein